MRIRCTNLTRLVRCGSPLDDNAVEVPDPLIVVEVVSPSSAKRDSGSKLEGYFRIPSVRHYLIVTTRNLAVIHHQRDDAGGITTRIIREGSIGLDPPGIELTGLFDRLDELTFQELARSTRPD